MLSLKKISYFLLLFYSLVTSHSSYSQKTASELSGDILANAFPVVAFASTLIYKNGDIGTLQFAKAMGTSFVLTHSLKRIIDKPRPNGGRYSFPSGHTSSAFTGAAFLQRRFGWAVGAPSYLLASYVGYTRIKARKHDIYDVGAGALIGIGSVYLFTKPFRNENVKLDVSKTGDAYILNLSIVLK